MNIVELVLELARHRPSAVAIIQHDRSITFGELATASAKAAHMLRHRGLQTGDAVLIFEPMGIELYILLAALWRTGLVAMVVDPSAGRQHLARSVERMPPRGFVGTGLAQLLRLSVSALRRIPCAWSTGFPLFSRRWQNWQTYQPHEPVEKVADDAPALVTFTSGSTGVPKGAVRSHAFLCAQHAAVARSLDHQQGAMDLATLPIFALANLASGQTVLIPNADIRRPGFIDAAPVLQQMTHFKPRSAVASPAFFERLADDCDKGHGSIAMLSALYTGGAPVFPQLLSRLQKLAPQTRVVAVYGSTEVEPIAEIAFSDMTTDDIFAQQNGKGLLVGPIVTGINLHICADSWGKPLPALSQAAFQTMHMPRNGIGEIVVAGEHVLPGYLGGAGDAETKIRVDKTIWHRTGDAGYIDKNGRLWLMGRCSAKIKDRHGTIYPFAIETAACSIPGIRRAAAVGIDGRRVLVYETTVQQVERQTMSDTLTTQLSWACIDQFIDMSIPLDKRHNAKVDYPLLMKQLRTHHGK